MFWVADEWDRMAHVTDGHPWAGLFGVDAAIGIVVHSESGRAGSLSRCALLCLDTGKGRCRVDDGQVGKLEHSRCMQL